MFQAHTYTVLDLQGIDLSLVSYRGQIQFHRTLVSSHQLLLLVNNTNPA